MRTYIWWKFLTCFNGDLSSRAFVEKYKSRAVYLSYILFLNQKYGYDFFNHSFEDFCKDRLRTGHWESFTYYTAMRDLNIYEFFVENRK